MMKVPNRISLILVIAATNVTFQCFAYKSLIERPMRRSLEALVSNPADLMLDSSFKSSSRSLDPDSFGETSQEDSDEIDGSSSSSRALKIGARARSAARMKARADLAKSRETRSTEGEGLPYAFEIDEPEKKNSTISENISRSLKQAKVSENSGEPEVSESDAWKDQPTRRLSWPATSRGLKMGVKTKESDLDKEREFLKEDLKVHIENDEEDDDDDELDPDLDLSLDEEDIIEFPSVPLIPKLKFPELPKLSNVISASPGLVTNVVTKVKKIKKPIDDKIEKIIKPLSSKLKDKKDEDVEIKIISSGPGIVENDQIEVHESVPSTKTTSKNDIKPIEVEPNKVEYEPSTKTYEVETKIKNPKPHKVKHIPKKKTKQPKKETQYKDFNKTCKYRFIDLKINLLSFLSLLQDFHFKIKFDKKLPFTFGLRKKFDKDLIKVKSLLRKAHFELEPMKSKETYRDLIRNLLKDIQKLSKTFETRSSEPKIIKLADRVISSVTAFDKICLIKF